MFDIDPHYEKVIQIIKTYLFVEEGWVQFIIHHHDGKYLAVRYGWTSGETRLLTYPELEPDGKPIPLLTPIGSANDHSWAEYKADHADDPLVNI